MTAKGATYFKYVTVMKFWILTKITDKDSSTTAYDVV